MKRHTEIRVTFETDGSNVIEAKGFKGKGCEQATRFLEKALGETIQQHKKPEYYQSARRNRRALRNLGEGGESS